ncbi:MAG: TatD family hydrolase [Candidatus Dormibacterales bacterium]
MAEAVSAGVTRMITMGVDLERSRKAVELAHAYEGVWAGVGHYPLEPAAFDKPAIRELAKDERVVAIGEIGLDFGEADEAGRMGQLERLDALMDMAVELDLPVSVHNRGADAQIELAIRNHPGLTGVMHYFALDWDWAQRFLDLGFYLSFAGLVTRPSRHLLRDVAARCPADRLLLETDSPHGNAHKRMGVPNRPAYLLDTAELVAQLRGLSIAELAEVESANGARLFRRMT